MVSEKIDLSKVVPALAGTNLFVKNSAQIRRFEFITKIVFSCVCLLAPKCHNLYSLAFIDTATETHFFLRCEIESRFIATAQR